MGALKIINHWKFSKLDCLSLSNLFGFLLTLLTFLKVSSDKELNGFSGEKNTSPDPVETTK